VQFVLFGPTPHAGQLLSQAIIRPTGTGVPGKNKGGRYCGQTYAD